jgi:multiple sugar transport system permease protein
MSDRVQDRAPPMAAAPPSWREKMEPWFFILPSVILLLAIGLYPVIYTLVASLQSWVMGMGPPSFGGLQNYAHAFTSSDFGHSVLRTLVLIVITLPIELALGMMIALALDSQNFLVLRRLLQICLVIPIAITPSVVGLLTQLMFNQQLGIINHLLGYIGIPALDWLGRPLSAYTTVLIVQIWEWTPFVALVLSAALSTVPWFRRGFGRRGIDPHAGAVDPAGPHLYPRLLPGDGLMSDLRAPLLRLLQAVGLVVTLLLILFPLYWMVTASLKTENDLFSMPPKWFFAPTLAAYADAIENTEVLGNLLNSVLVTVSAVALGLLVGAPAAYGIARYRFRGRRDVWFWYVTNWMLVPVVVLIPFYLTASWLGLINNPVVLILVYQVFIVPLVVWLLVDQFSAVPVALEEAAQLDGLSRVKIFLKISLPLVKPGIAVAAILSGIFAWNDMLYAFILTPSPDARTAPTVVLNYLGGYVIPWPQVMATSTMVCAPVIIGGIIVHKYIARGLTMGAVK